MKHKLTAAPAGAGFFCLSLVLVFVVSSCTLQSHETKNGSNGIAEVIADVETQAVINPGDAADDPAIWVHPTDPSMSRIYGSDKKGGIAVYDLQGKELFYYTVGNINNIDVRYNFPLGKEKVDILGGSNRSTNNIDIFRIEPDSGKLLNISARDFHSGVGEVYGFSLYHSPKLDTFYAFVNSKSGNVEQWKLFPTDTGTIDAKLIREFSVGGQTEGMVADDILGYLYIGQEEKGIWKYLADPGKHYHRVKVADTSKKYIVPDVEGLSLYYADSSHGYLIASVQGNNTFAIFERQGRNKYIGRFKIVDNGIDGVMDTDGIDVTNLNLGSTFPEGVFVVQDGFNTAGSDSLNQNFKMIGWVKISSVFDPALDINNSFDIR